MVVKGDPPKLPGSLEPKGTLKANLDLIERIAAQAEANDESKNSESPFDLDSENGRQPAGELGDSDNQTYALLNELKNDIHVLKREQDLHETSAEKQLHGLLKELRRDVEQLRREQDYEWSPSPQERHLRAMLADLRSEIETLHDLSASPLGYSRPAHDQGLGGGAAPPAWRAWLTVTAVLAGSAVGVLAGIVVLLTSGILVMSSNGVNFDRMQTIHEANVPAMPPAVIIDEQLIESAKKLIARGEILAARGVLEATARQGSAMANLLLAHTYDSLHLQQMSNPQGAMPDTARAQRFYRAAARAGNLEAAQRLVEIQELDGDAR